MLTPKALFPLLGLLAVACINLPDIEEARPGTPSADGGDGGTSMDGGSDAGALPGPTDGGVDQTAPAVIRTSPPQGATRVPLDLAVEVDFSEEMMASMLKVTSVPAATFTLASWAPELRRAVFVASAPLVEDQQYALSVEGKDLAGNALLSAYNFAFRTVGPPDTTPPTLLLHSPAANATGVPRQSSIRLTFSEPMNQPSVEQAFSIATQEPTTVGAIVWNTAGTEVSFTPTNNFLYGSEVFWSISTAARDLEGNALAEEIRRHFTVVRTTTITLPTSRVDCALVSTSPPPQTVPWALGDDSNNQPYHGFVTFHFQPLLSDCRPDTTIVSALLTWPYSDPGAAIFNSLGKFLIDPVYYYVTGNDYLYSLSSIGSPLSLTYQDFNAQAGSIPVTALVADAWNQRQIRGDSVQFRLKFQATTDNDNNSDALQINPNNLYLRVTCEVP